MPYGKKGKLLPGEFLPDPAQGGVRYSKVGGNMLKRHMLKDLRVLVQELNVACFGRIGYEGERPFLEGEITIHEASPTRFPKGLDTMKELLEFIKANPPANRILHHLYLFFCGNPEEERRYL